MRTIPERLLRAMMTAAVLLVPAALFAQLDDHCMVAALNRTAPVQADGHWVLPRESSFMERWLVAANGAIQLTNAPGLPLARA